MILKQITLFYEQSPMWFAATILFIIYLLISFISIISSRKKVMPTLDDIGKKTIKKHIVTGRHQQQNFVLQTSDKLKALKDLNESFNFNKDVTLEYEIEVILKSAQQYARFDFKERFKKEYKDNPEKFNALIEPILENKYKYEEYVNAVDILRDTKYTYDHEEVREEIYRSIEDKLFESNIQKPVVDIAFYTYPLYRTGSGRETYHDMEVLWLKDIEKILKEIDDDLITKEARDRERTLMSDSLRYDVLKRDNFRCTICGRTAADGIKLHVDHIMPIAKGGKTEMSNLRTLCNQCNSGKSDKWDENGIN